MAEGSLSICIKTVEMHTGGEPLRVFLPGQIEPNGKDILAKRRNMQKEYDQYRILCMQEPRGHFDMYGALLVTPTNQKADLAVLFMHCSGYSTMCGHGVISLGRFAIDYGFVKNPTIPETKVNIECPCGLVETFVQYDGEKTGAVRFNSVPAFVYDTDVEINTEMYGSLKTDVVYGGTFYCLISVQQLDLDISSTPITQLVQVGGNILEAARNQLKISFPGIEDLAIIYGVLFTDDNDTGDGPYSQLCIFADRQVDRSPCGSATTARVAFNYLKGLQQMNETRTFKNSKTGSEFKAKPVCETVVGDHKAVQVEVSGRGFYSGTASFTIEADDELGAGFLLK